MWLTGLSITHLKRIIIELFTFLEVLFINCFVDSLPWLVVILISCHRNNNMLVLYINPPPLHINDHFRDITRFVSFTWIVTCIFRMLIKIVYFIELVLFREFISINWIHFWIPKPMAFFSSSLKITCAMTWKREFSSHWYDLDPPISADTNEFENSIHSNDH